MPSIASTMRSGRDKLDGVLAKTVLSAELRSMHRVLRMVQVVLVALLEMAMVLMGPAEDPAAIRAARA